MTEVLRGQTRSVEPNVLEPYMKRLRLCDRPPADCSAETQRALGEETLGRAGGERYIIGRRWKEILVAKRVNPRRADNRRSRSLAREKRDVCYGASAVTGAIATFGSTLIMRTAPAMTRHTLT